MTSAHPNCKIRRKMALKTCLVPRNRYTYIDSALIEFGKITHARADYYSHSNTVERKLGLAGTDRLRTGFFSFSNHFFGSKSGNRSYIDIIKKYSDGVLPTYLDPTPYYYTHRALNKDNASSLEGKIIFNGNTLHVHARDAAIVRLKSEWEVFKKKAPCIAFAISKLE